MPINRDATDSGPAATDSGPGLVFLGAGGQLGAGSLLPSEVGVRNPSSSSFDVARGRRVGVSSGVVMKGWCVGARPLLCDETVPTECLFIIKRVIVHIYYSSSLVGVHEENGALVISILCNHS